jgi:hypothetical protein
MNSPSVVQSADFQMGRSILASRSVRRGSRFGR